MKKTLTKNKYNLYHIKDGVRIEGAHSELSGNVSGLSGNVTELYGNVFGLYGNVSELYGNVSGISGSVSRIYGNVSGLSGDITGLYGDLNDCEITDEDRKRGVDISELIEE